MRKTLTKLAIAFSGIFATAFAQQDPQFTQFQHAKLAYNPAYAGTNGAICFDALYRQQWVSFPGAPKTGLFGFNMPILGTAGVGLNIISDQLGFDKTMMVRGSFAFHRKWGADGAGLFSVALDAGVLQKQISGTWVAPQTLNDPSIPNNPYNSTTLQGTNAPALNKLTPDFGFGLYYTIPNKMYVGVSTSHIAAQDLKGNSAQSSVSGANVIPGYALNFQMARHYYIIGGYTFRLEGGEHNIMPNIKIKSDAASTQLDVNLTYMYKTMLWLGASYRLQDAIAPSVGYMAPFGLKVGYSYDVTLSKIRGYSSGTHEIVLGYCFKPKKVSKISSHTNVRFLED